MTSAVPATDPVLSQEHEQVAATLSGTVPRPVVQGFFDEPTNTAMLAAAGLMFKRRFVPAAARMEVTRESVPKLVGYGSATGLLSGFLGIGGGFLIVPGLVAATGMPLVSAVGCSLVVITAFGVTTGLSYALSHLVDWALVLAFVAGGAGGGIIGLRLRSACVARKGALDTVLAAIIGGAGLVMLMR
ncbi:sulfite exporter TauE/SafE family protein [Methylobacterium sp. 10]|uniref:sulfite exporter TauE/SafE family protein n=1 Tax=Methylobacterium sp. 10 TaxID=1101191 RepID=UPI0004B41758